jgi:hypothetical protein
MVPWIRSKLNPLHVQQINPKGKKCAGQSDRQKDENFIDLSRKRWQQEMGKRMFQVVNAYTRAAQFEGLSAEASYRLQKVAGMVLGMVKQMKGKAAGSSRPY